MFNNSMVREITGNSEVSPTKRIDRTRLTMYVIILLRSVRDARIFIIYSGVGTIASPMLYENLSPETAFMAFAFKSARYPGQ